MTVVQEAAEPHTHRGKLVQYTHDPNAGDEIDQPAILRQPEIIHGLRNLVQNAVDFARSTVWIEAHWTNTQITLRIMDDGRGFPPQLLGRIGDPFVRRRKTSTERAQRPEYEGMGLGLFIAKTLLERSGAELTFANGADPYGTWEQRDNHVGAIVEVVWPRNKVDARSGENAVVVGRNEQIRA